MFSAISINTTGLENSWEPSTSFIILWFNVNIIMADAPKKNALFICNKQEYNVNELIICSDYDKVHVSFKT